jgi:hypothetical protein
MRNADRLLITSDAYAALLSTARIVASNTNMVSPISFGTNLQERTPAPKRARYSLPVKFLTSAYSKLPTAVNQDLRDNNRRSGHLSSMNPDMDC